MSGGWGRVIGRIREDIPGKARRRWGVECLDDAGDAPRQTCLGIFCNKKGDIDQQVTSLLYILPLKEETLTNYLLVQHC